jgi:hypothetical protein
MSMGKLNRAALEELYVYWYYKVNNQIPEKKAERTKIDTIRLIWKLKRSYKRGDIK